MAFRLSMHGLCGTAFGMSVMCLLCVLPCAHSLISCTAGYGASFSVGSDNWVRPTSRIGYAVDYSGSCYAYKIYTSSASTCAAYCTGSCDTFFIYVGNYCYARTKCAGVTSGSYGNGCCGSASIVYVQCNAVVIPTCSAGTYLSGSVCTSCPGNSNSPDDSKSLSDCTCNSGYVGNPANNDACVQLECGVGTFLSLLTPVDAMDELMSRHRPHVSSRAEDWNIYTGTFNTQCDGQPCSTQGYRSSGTVSKATDNSGNSLLQGNTATVMNWGANSIPSAFTICSLTRYAGGTNGRILSCHGNPLGNLNWLHGHWSNSRGVNHYNGWQNSNSRGTLTDWVVVCGRNTVNAGAISTIVDGVTTSTAVGGTGGCAVGINQPSEYSDWQFAEMHVWDYHLDNEDFQLAHDSMLDGKNGVQGTASCAACPTGKYSTTTGA